MKIFRAPCFLRIRLFRFLWFLSGFAKSFEKYTNFTLEGKNSALSSELEMKDESALHSFVYIFQIIVSYEFKCII